MLRGSRLLNQQLVPIICGSRFVGSFCLAAIVQRSARIYIRARNRRVIWAEDIGARCCGLWPKKRPKKNDSRPGINSLSYVAKTPRAQPRRSRRLRIGATAAPCPPSHFQVSALSGAICPPLFSPSFLPSLSLPFFFFSYLSA